MVTIDTKYKYLFVVVFKVSTFVIEKKIKMRTLDWFVGY